MEFSFSPKVADNAPAWLLLGICGAGMRSFAQHLTAMGIPVIGSDHDRAGLQRFSHTAPPNITLLDWTVLQRGLTPQISTAVHSVAVDAANPELAALRRRGLRVLSLPQALAEQFSGTPQICVAGTHGKSTTTGMLWWILHHSGHPVARYVGAEFQSGDSLPAYQPVLRPFHAAVLEACEYRDSFLSLQPAVCVLTGIEDDHFDWFKEPSAAARSFGRFVGSTSAGGSLVYSADCEASRRLAADFVSGPMISWSASGRAADWTLVSRPCRSGSAVAAGLLQPSGGGSPIELQLRVPGEHNLKNAAAAVLAAQQRGINPKQSAEILSTFPGMRRRFEHRGTWRGVELIDDYAHHPTAVAVTLRTVRQVYPGRRILVVFEPHQLSRTRRMLPEFASALELADEVLVVPVLAARETAPEAVRLELSRELVQRICGTGGCAKLVGDLDQVPGKLEDAVHAGDILVTMGAGRTNLIHDEIHRKIHRDSAA